MLYQIGDSYAFLRRYAEQKSTFDRILAIEPNNLGAKAERAFVDVDWARRDSLNFYHAIIIGGVHSFYIIQTLARLLKKKIRPEAYQGQ